MVDCCSIMYSENKGAYESKGDELSKVQLILFLLFIK